MFCPIQRNPTISNCKNCKSKECLDFNLLVLCEHPDNTSPLVAKLKKMLVNQRKVNVFINSMDNEINTPTDLIPSIHPSLQKYFDAEAYNVIIYRNFQLKKHYDDLIRLILESTGGGVVIYGSNEFAQYIQNRIYSVAQTFSLNEQPNLFKKIKVKFVKENLKNYVSANQQSLF